MGKKEIKEMVDRAEAMDRAISLAIAFVVFSLLSLLPLYYGEDKTFAFVNSLTTDSSGSKIHLFLVFGISLLSLSGLIAGAMSSHPRQIIVNSYNFLVFGAVLAFTYVFWIGFKPLVLIAVGVTSGLWLIAYVALKRIEDPLGIRK